MSNNPYQIPSEKPSGKPSATTQWRYIPLKVLTLIATIGLILVCALTVLAAGVEIAGSLMFPTFHDFEAPLTSELERVLILSHSGLALLMLPGLIFNAVVICMFMYRSNANVRAMGAHGVENTPGWCGGYWFVPIAHLFMPYRCMAEISKASQDPQGSNWKSLTPHFLLGAWWGCWLISNVLSNLSANPAMLEMMGNSIWFFTLGDAILTVLAAFMLIQVLRSITEDQKRFAAKLGYYS